METLYFVANLLKNFITIIVSLIAVVVGLYLQKLPAPKKNLVKLLWILGLVFICLSVLSYLLTETGLFKKNLGEYYQDEIEKYQNEIIYLRGQYESIDHSDSLYQHLTFRDKAILLNVIEESPEFARGLEKIPSNQINFGYRVLKFDLLTYILTISAEVDTNRIYKENYLRRAFNSSDSLDYLINRIRMKVEENEYYEKLDKWIRDEHTVCRLHSLRAWLWAISARLDGQITNEERRRVSDELRQVSTDYRQLSPMNQNPSLRIVLDSQNIP